MKGLENFIALCMEKWPGVPIGVTVYPSISSGYRLSVSIDRWRIPGDFSESDLVQPRAMIRTLQMSMGDWNPLYPQDLTQN